MDHDTAPHSDQPPTTLHHETSPKAYEPIHSVHNNLAPGDDDSVRSVSNYNATARNSTDFEKTGFSDIKGGVNVQRAEAEFAELSKELSRASNASRRLSHVQSRQSRKGQAIPDVEKGGLADSDAPADEPFDLEKTLRGSRDEEEAAGIKSKRIGVVWDGLTVSGEY